MTPEDLRKALKTARGACTRAENKTKELQEKIKKFKRQGDEHFKKLRKLRQQYSKKIHRGPFVGEDEGTLRDLLRRLGETCADFAESYTIPWLEGKSEQHPALTETEKDNIFWPLRKYKAISREGERLVLKTPKSAKILVNAILAHIVWFEILGRPLFFLEGINKFGGSKSLESDLQWLFDFITKGMFLLH